MRPDRTKTYFWPDFWVDDDGYVEVKGFEHKRGMTKLALFRDQYPSETIRLVGAPEYAQICESVAHLIPTWEVTPFNANPQRRKKLNQAPEDTARKPADP